MKFYPGAKVKLSQQGIDNLLSMGADKEVEKYKDKIALVYACKHTLNENTFFSDIDLRWPDGKVTIFPEEYLEPA